MSRKSLDKSLEKSQDLFNIKINNNNKNSLNENSQNKTNYTSQYYTINPKTQKEILYKKIQLEEIHEYKDQINHTFKNSTSKPVNISINNTYNIINHIDDVKLEGEENQPIPVSFWDSITSCGCVNGRDDPLNSEEIKKFRLIKKNIDENFDINNERSINYLNSLIEQINISINQYKLNIECVDKYNFCRIVGLTSNALNDEFLGGGNFSIKFMIYFVKKFHGWFDEIYKSKIFLFGHSCIRILYLFKLYFFLDENEGGGNLLEVKQEINNIKPCTRKQLRKFIYNYSLHKDDFICDMLSNILISSFQKFSEDYSRSKNTDIIYLCSKDNYYLEAIVRSL